MCLSQVEPHFNRTEGSTESKKERRNRPEGKRHQQREKHLLCVTRGKGSLFLLSFATVELLYKAFETEFLSSACNSLKLEG
jgi:hypothetical protein